MGSFAFRVFLSMDFFQAEVAFEEIGNNLNSVQAICKEDGNYQKLGWNPSPNEGCQWHLKMVRSSEVGWPHQLSLIICKRLCQATGMQFSNFSLHCSCCALVLFLVLSPNLSIFIFSSYVPGMRSFAYERKEMIMLRFQSLKNKSISLILFYFCSGYKG